MDIPPLAHHVLGNAMEALGKAVQGFTPEAMDCLCDYHWPGNVRELQNEIYRMLALVDGDMLGAELQSSRVRNVVADDVIEIPECLDGNLREKVEMLEGRIIRETLIRLRWNRTKAAEELGLSRVGLRNKLRRYGMESQS